MPPSVCKPWSLVYRSMTWIWCIREETRHSYQTPFQDCFSQPVSEMSQSLKQFNMIKYLPVSEERLQQIQKDIEADESLQVFKVVIQKGWPKHKSIFPYFNMCDEMSIQDSLIFKGEWVMVPHASRSKLLKRIPSSYLGVNSCLNREHKCAYWPRMATDIKSHVWTCEVCHEHEQGQAKETMMSLQSLSYSHLYL